MCRKQYKIDMKKVKILLMASVLLLAACGKNTPQCSDPEVLSLVKSIYQQTANKAISGEPAKSQARFRYTEKESKLSVETITVDSVDEKVGKSSCQADLQVTVPATAMVDMDPETVAHINNIYAVKQGGIQGNTLKVQINYTAQRTADKKELLVTAVGLKQLVDLVYDVSILRFQNKPFPPDASSNTATTPLIPTSTSTVSSNTSGESPPSSTPSSAVRLVKDVTLLGFECGDTCQLKYQDPIAGKQSALCSDAKLCRGWSDNPASFAASVGKQADLTIARQFVKEGGVTLDSITELTVKAGVPDGSKNATAASGASVSSGVTSLCSADEDVVFACSTGKKVASVCRTKELSATAGQMTYRLAPIGQSPEITYPMTIQPAQKAFQRGELQLVGDKAVKFLSFDKGNIRYVVYAAEGKSFYKSGVAVEQSGKRIANLVCQGDATTNLDSALFARAAIPVDSRGFDVP